ncbi:MAG: DUF3592 domain-containing protein [Chitinophagales bacterium]
MEHSPLVLLIILVFGLVFLYSTIESAVFLIRIKKNGVPCTGRMVHYVSDDNNRVQPLITFTTEDGKTIKGLPYFYMSAQTVKEIPQGKAIDIIYQSDDPAVFMVQHEGWINFSVLLFKILGSLFFTGLGLTLFIR